MKALVKTKKGVGNMELTEKEIPQICGDEVLIKVKYAGICGTDIHIYHDQYPYWPPVTVGHEFSGIVEKVGESVTDFKVGDRVVGEPHNKACGKCHLCRNGKIQICAEKRSIGWGIDGAFAEYVKMPEKLLHKIPENVSLKSAAMAEPCAIVAHQLLERTGVCPGDTVVVMGVGAIGLIAAQLAKTAGASQVILGGCTGDVEYRLEVAKKLKCFDRFVNVQEESIADVVDKATDGKGADLVVEASGAGSAIANGIRVLKKAGKFCAIGMTARETVDFPYNEAMMKAIDFKFNMSSSYNGWIIALNLMNDGKLNLEPMASTDKIENWKSAFEAVESGKALKMLLTAGK